MSIVLVGGNDRMTGRYKDICKKYSYKAKVFIKMPADFDKKIGCPDLAVVFCDTCSHKMLQSVNKRAEKANFPVVHCGSASCNSLKNILEKWSVKENGI